MDAEQLPQIIQWIKSGKVAEARQALRQRLQADPHDERAWLWLADSMPDKPQRMAVLEHALKSNPQSELLRRSLARLKIQQFAQAAPVSEIVGSGEDYRTLPMSGMGGNLPGSELALATAAHLPPAGTPAPAELTLQPESARVEAPSSLERKPAPKSLPISREGGAAPSPGVPLPQAKPSHEPGVKNPLARKYAWKATAWLAALVGVFILAAWIIWQMIH